MKNLTRRDFLLFLGVGALTASSGKAFAFANASMMNRRARKFNIAWTQLKYQGTWNPNPKGPERFLTELRQRTSVEPEPTMGVVEFADDALFEKPFLCISGRGSFPQLGPRAPERLRRYVESGGSVFFDDATGIADSGFMEGALELTRRAFPEKPVAQLPIDHALFQSFYILDSVPGRKIINPALLGIEIDGLNPVLFSANDLGGAWDGDLMGGFINPCIPGGERQREMSFRFGINLMMYVLNGTYKKDQVHIPFILQRRKMR